MNKAIASVAGICFAGVAVAAGCSDDAPTSNGPTIDEYSTQMASLECKKMFACCDMSELSKRAQMLGIFPIPSTVDECAATFSARMKASLDDYLREAITSGRLVYNAAKAGRCIANAQPENCATKLDDDPDCNALWTGAVLMGGACKDDGECADAESSCLGGEVHGDFGECVSNSKEGESCLERQCLSGLVCINELPTFTCRKPAANGEACTSGYECASDHCDATGHCAQLHVVGESCVGEDCTMSYCDSATMKCVALKGPGETCTVDGTCSSGPCDLTAQMCPPAPAQLCDGK